MCEWHLTAGAMDLCQMGDYLGNKKTQREKEEQREVVVAIPTMHEEEELITNDFEYLKRAWSSSDLLTTFIFKNQKNNRMRGCRLRALEFSY